MISTLGSSMKGFMGWSRTEAGDPHCTIGGLVHMFWDIESISSKQELPMDFDGHLE